MGKQENLEAIVREVAAELLNDQSGEGTLRTAVKENIADLISDMVCDSESVDEIMTSAITRITTEYVGSPEFRQKVLDYIQNDLGDAIKDWVDEHLSEALYDRVNQRNR